MLPPKATLASEPSATAPPSNPAELSENVVVVSSSLEDYTEEFDTAAIAPPKHWA